MQVDESGRRRKLYARAYAKCFRGKTTEDGRKAFNQRSRPKDCPYYEETRKRGHRAVKKKNDLVGLAKQGKAVRWPDHLAKAQQYGKIVGRLDSEYVEGSSHVTADDLAYDRRKKFVLQRKAEKDGYGISWSNYKRISAEASKTLLRGTRVPSVDVKCTRKARPQDEWNIKLNNQAFASQIRFRDRMILYNPKMAVPAKVMDGRAVQTLTFSENATFYIIGTLDDYQYTINVEYTEGETGDMVKEQFQLDGLPGKFYVDASEDSVTIYCKNSFETRSVEESIEGLGVAEQRPAEVNGAKISTRPERQVLGLFVPCQAPTPWSITAPPSTETALFPTFAR